MSWIVNIVSFNKQGFKFLTFFNHSNGRILANPYKSYQKRCVTGGGCKTSAHAEGQRSGCCQTHASSSRTGRAERHEKSRRSDLDFASKLLLGHITFATFVHTPMTFCWSFLLGFDSSAADETSCTFSLLVCFWCHENSQLKAVLDWHYQQSTMITQIPWLLHILRDIAFAAWNRPSIETVPLSKAEQKLQALEPVNPETPEAGPMKKRAKATKGQGTMKRPAKAAKS